jgi:hypothetical protein
LTAIRHNGGAAVPCTELSPEQHRELRIALAVRAGVLAPGLAPPGRVEITAGRQILFSSDFMSPLDQPAASQHVKPLPVAALWAKAGQHDQTLHVKVSIAGVLKCSQPLRLQRSVRMTTFEGALKRNPESLGNVEEEYEAIVQGLRA